MKFLYTVQIVNERRDIWMTTEVVAVSDRQALLLASKDNTGWMARRIVSMKVVC